MTCNHEALRALGPEDFIAATDWPEGKTRVQALLGMTLLYGNCPNCPEGKKTTLAIEITCDGAGDYYERRSEDRSAALDKVQEARDRGASPEEIRKLQEAALWAGYTGD